MIQVHLSIPDEHIEAFAEVLEQLVGISTSPEQRVNSRGVWFHTLTVLKQHGELTTAQLARIENCTSETAGARLQQLVHRGCAEFDWVLGDARGRMRKVKRFRPTAATDGPRPITAPAPSRDQSLRAPTKRVPQAPTVAGRAARFLERRRGGVYTPAQLAGELHCDSAAARLALAALERDGLVRKRTVDGRAVGYSAA